MSEQENTRVVQRIYENFKNGDIQSILETMADDIEWQLPSIENAPFSGKRSGREQVAGFFRTLADAQDVQQFEPQDFVAQGEKVVALGHYSWRTKSTGRHYAGDWAHVFTFRDGKVVRFHEYRHGGRRRPSPLTASTRVAQDRRRSGQPTTAANRSGHEHAFNTGSGANAELG
ncbi:MAG TPA: nuclear transport factor 2 family protein [Pyrinomonadaceae bacterium]|jgi:hypothetical protein|nr:nuclear transport factor 2 family protein [Pyrinomonadaceae bacterium]